MSTVTAKEAFNTLKTNFNLQELTMLAFSVGIPYEDLEGSGKSGKALAMVQYAQRHGKFDQLVEEMMAPRDENVTLSPPEGVPIGNVIHNYYGEVVQGNKVGGDNIEIGSVSNSSGIAVGKDSSAEVTTQTPPPANTPQPVNQYTFHGNVVGSVIGDGSLQAENIAGRDIIIGQEPKNKQEFQESVNRLRSTHPRSHRQQRNSGQRSRRCAG